MRSQFHVLALITLVLFISGCHSVKEQVKEASIPAYQPTNYYAPNPVPSQVIRVAVLPLYFEPYEDAYLTVLDDTFRAQLSKRNLFEIIPVSRNDLDTAFRMRQISSTEPLPYDFMQRMNDEYLVDAVLFTDLTSFEPYKPIAIGIRSKLVMLNGDVVWAFDDIFDAGALPVAVGAKRFTQEYTHTPFPLDTGASGLQSPEQFSKYVAFEMYATMRKNN
ncbi:MAG TPA: hypothetical protein DIU37_06745 [Opitutae bacterium]|nr:hypothetical protein [Opitutae bacterium]|tara:strand:- start:611 stop:1267 length:657 start_codon:yes stop_codon:yes gene_type:complete